MKKMIILIAIIYFLLSIPFNILRLFNLRLDGMDVEQCISGKIAVGMENIKGGLHSFENEYLKVDLPFFDWTRKKEWVREGEASTSIDFAGTMASYSSYYGLGDRSFIFTANITQFHNFSKENFNTYIKKAYNPNECFRKNVENPNLTILICQTGTKKNMREYIVPSNFYKLVMIIRKNQTEITFFPYFKDLENTKLIKNFISSIKFKKPVINDLEK